MQQVSARRAPRCHVDRMQGAAEARCRGPEANEASSGPGGSSRPWQGGGINAVADTAGAGVVSPSKQEKKGLLAFPSVDFLKFEGGLYSVQGSLTLRANADEVYAVLLDFEDSHNIFESIEDTQVVMSGGNVQKLNQVRRGGGGKLHRESPGDACRTL
mmetsp:Transcript_50155/g.160648  ORF Transcript_50155/g.160648 Transcript_50155/m.160648 type:complete len:158 (+) Transcript_50155:247-720(+)